VLSPDHFNFGPFGGGRIAVGRWLADPRFGIEAEGFALGSKGASFAGASDGTVPLRTPFFNVGPGFPAGNTSFFLADPGFASGGQAISSSLQLWGVEGNGIYRTYVRPNVSVSVLAGVRYIDLRERLSIVSNETLIPPFVFGGPGAFTGTDNFSTTNQFVGAQIGVKAQGEWGRFDGSVVAKVALGDNYQSVSINGNSLVSGVFAIPSGGAPGGVFTQLTNIGVQNRNQFAVVPEAQLQLGYKVTSGLRLFVGYDFIYMSNVVRPGNQVDTTLNFSSNPAINGPGTVLTGPARPQPLFNGSSFWAQGVTVGASLQF
jgi:hypothetical protein